MDDKSRLRERTREILRYLDDFPAYAREVLKVRNKDGDLVPFELNRMQRRLWSIVKDKLDAGEPVRLYVLKSRQLGASTLIEGLAYWFTTLRPYREGLIVAHDIDSAIKIFNMSHRFYTMSPDRWRPMKQISNRRELVFANPKADREGEDPGLQSSLLIATAKDKDIGVGATLQFVHLSEFARYEKSNPNIKDTMAALKQAIPRRPETFLFIETTAQGFGYAKDVWDEEGAYEHVFISWLADDEYRNPDGTHTVEEDGRKRREVLTPEDLSANPASRWGDEMALVPFVRKELTFWYPETEWTDQALDEEVLRRLAWRRDMIQDQLENDARLFRQEYPTFAQEAFLATGQTVFDQFKLADMVEEARPLEPVRYKFDALRQDFRRAPHGALKVYEPPLKGAEYSIGVDVAEGVEGGDFSAVKVLKVPQLETVAVYRDRIDPDDLADVVYTIGRAYNTALVTVEVTGPGLATQLRLKKEFRYGRLYRRRSFDRIGKKLTGHLGWSTNTTSKEVLVNDLRGAIRDGVLIEWDDESLNEMQHYIVDDKGRYTAAQGKHDDLVLATALALQGVKQMQWKFKNIVSGPPEAVPGTFEYEASLIDNHSESDRPPQPVSGF